MANDNPDCTYIKLNHEIECFSIFIVYFSFIFLVHVWYWNWINNLENQRACFQYSFWLVKLKTLHIFDIMYKSKHIIYFYTKNSFRCFKEKKIVIIQIYFSSIFVDTNCINWKLPTVLHFGPIRNKVRIVEQRNICCFQICSLNCIILLSCQRPIECFTLPSLAVSMFLIHITKI